MELQRMQQPRHRATQQTAGTLSDQLPHSQRPPHLRQLHNQTAVQAATAAVAATAVVSMPAGSQPMSSLRPNQRRQCQLTPDMQLDRQKQQNLLLQAGQRRQEQRTSLLRRWHFLGTLELLMWLPQQLRVSSSKSLAAAMTAAMAAAMAAAVPAMAVKPKLGMVLKMLRRSKRERTSSFVHS